MDQALIVSRRDIDVGAGKYDPLLALASVAARFGAAGSGGRRDLAVAHGDFALVEIFDAKGVPKGMSKLLEFEDLADIGLFVDTMEKLDAAADMVVASRLPLIH